MAVITAASTHSAQGILQAFKFAAIGDGDTFEGPEAPKAYWAVSTADPTTNTSAGINVSESGGTYTFFPGVATLTGTLIIFS